MFGAVLEGTDVLAVGLVDYLEDQGAGEVLVVEERGLVGGGVEDGGEGNRCGGGGLGGQGGREGGGEGALLDEAGLG